MKFRGTGKKSLHKPHFNLPYQPYVFILKEGAGINTNPMDYSLLLIKITHPEIIKSP